MDKTPRPEQHQQVSMCRIPENIKKQLRTTKILATKILKYSIVV